MKYYLYLLLIPLSLLVAGIIRAFHGEHELAMSDIQLATYMVAIWWIALILYKLVTTPKQATKK